MARSAPRRPARPLWLLVALAVMLLVTVSATAERAQANGTALALLTRELAALRAHHEALDAVAGEGARRGAAFNTELGDGGTDLHRRAMLRAARAALRHNRALLARQQGPDRREPAIRAAAVIETELQGLVYRLSLDDGGAATAADGADDLAGLGSALARLESAAAALPGP